MEKEDRAVAYLVAAIPYARDTPSQDYLRTLTETTPRHTVGDLK
jgi:hypothetical protein